MADSTAKQPNTPAPNTPDAPNTPAEPEPASSTTPVAPVPVSAPDTGYTPAGVPTLDGVREKIEARLGTALGATELAAETPEGKTATEQFEARQKAAEDKLKEIRASMRTSD